MSPAINLVSFVSRGGPVRARTRLLEPGHRFCEKTGGRLKLTVFRRNRAGHMETPEVRNCRSYVVKTCGDQNRFLPSGRCVRIDLSRVRSQDFLWDYRCSPELALDRLSSERMAPASHRLQQHRYFWPSCPPVARVDVTSTVAEVNCRSSLASVSRSVWPELSRVQRGREGDAEVVAVGRASPRPS